MYPNNFQPKLSDEVYEDDFADPMITPPDWKALITESMDANCLAPSDEALGLAFDHYCDLVDAPFQAREAEMAAFYADILGGIADLQVLAPDVLEEILASDEEVAA